jgi:hypothetical protein
METIMYTQQRARTEAARIPFTLASNSMSIELFFALTLPYVSLLLLIKTPLILPSLSLLSLASAVLVALAASGAASRNERAHTTSRDAGPAL